jgi:hypothetical protein
VVMDDDDMLNLLNVMENEQQPEINFLSIKLNLKKKFEFKPLVRLVVEHHVILDIYQMIRLYQELNH